eukprot:637869-Karenia_brevis.AAC.1
MEFWYEIEVGAILGPDVYDDKEVVILGRKIRWTDFCKEYEADPKHRRMVLQYFGFDDKSRVSVVDGDREDEIEEWEKELLGNQEAKEFRR